jgi:hypothetical protein
MHRGQEALCVAHGVPCAMWTGTGIYIDERMDVGAACSANAPTKRTFASWGLHEKQRLLDVLGENRCTIQGRGTEFN